MSGRSLALLGAAAATVMLTIGLPARGAYTPSAEGSHLAVATDDADATRAALAVMRAGGNAFDGAIAASLALGVVNPTASGLGGGGFALVYVAREHKLVALDFRETAPAHAGPDSLVVAGKRGTTVGVIGEPAGLEWLSVHYAHKSLADDAAPAAQLAQRGFLVGRHLAEVLPFVQRMVEGTPLTAELYPGGQPLAYRSTWVRPALARTIARFGAEGAKPFYTGDIAPKIVEAARAEGSAIDAADLAAYKVRERAPLTRVVGARTIATMPAPSAGGLMLQEMLGMFGADSSSSLKAVGFESSSYFHTVAEGLRGAIADRARFAGDPDLDPGVEAAYGRALDPKQLDARRSRIEPYKVHPSVEFKTKESGTTHLIVTDDEGNVVSLTTTVNGPFGARIVAGDTGIILNNQLDDFTAPSEVAPFGVTGPGPNRARPGARPVSSMAPTIVLENGAPILALGGSGGRRIATAVTQAAVARLIFGLDPSACVSAPRIHTNGTSVLVDAEISEDVRAGLRLRGETVEPNPFNGSAVQMIGWERGPGGVRVLAASDPRKYGFAAAL
ncbi:MAG TPA: gamma-glutamyltransferase [Polyangiaceae bacterium]|nr:gamma-glutamyltransferase [Polyangiaceae bacterium]